MNIDSVKICINSGKNKFNHEIIYLLTWFYFNILLTWISNQWRNTFQIFWFHYFKNLSQLHEGIIFSNTAEKVRECNFY